MWKYVLVSNKLPLSHREAVSACMGESSNFLITNTRTHPLLLKTWIERQHVVPTQCPFIIPRRKALLFNIDQAHCAQLKSFYWCFLSGSVEWVRAGIYTWLFTAWLAWLPASCDEQLAPLSWFIHRFLMDGSIMQAHGAYIVSYR